MIGWNYRVLIEEVESELVYGLIEAYYDDEHEIELWARAGRPYGETLEELQGDLELMLQALERKPLTLSDLP